MKFLSSLITMMVVPLTFLLANAQHLRSDEGRKTLEAQSRVVGGTSTTPNAYPYMASVRANRGRYENYCGATMITPDIALTAAHCDFNFLTVVLNPYSLTTMSNDTRIYDVVDRRKHNRYNPTTLQNDFMILQINETSAVPLIRLNTDPNLPTPGTVMSVVGWGTTKYGSSSPPPNQILQEFHGTTAISNAVCQPSYSPTIIYPSMLCAIQDRACQGDSGGPLFVKGSRPSRDVQFGIISWGTGCNELRYPGVYSHIGNQWEWIRSSVCDLSPYEAPSYFKCFTDVPSTSPTPIPTSKPTPIPTAIPTHQPTKKPTTTPSASPVPTITQVAIIIEITTDANPTDTSWELRSSSGALFDGRAFGEIQEASTVIQYHVFVNARDTYSLQVQDRIGDGVDNGVFTVYLGTTKNQFSPILGRWDREFGGHMAIKFGLVPKPTIAPTPASPLAPTPAPSVAPTPAPTKVASEPLTGEIPTPSICFPGNALCRVEGQGDVPMKSLKLGDKVLVEGGNYQPIYSFAHHAGDIYTEYVQLTTSTAKIELSREHMVFVEGGQSVPAGTIKVGESLLLDNDEIGVVDSIRTVFRQGAYAPLTASGTVIVNGVKASSYVAFQQSPTLRIAGVDTGLSYQFLSHSFEGPHRLWCQYVSACKVETYTSSGISDRLATPHRVVKWFFNQHPVVMTVLSIPMLAVLAFPMTTFLSVLLVVAMVVNRLKFRVKCL